MPAYSFKELFVPMIQDGTKKQTIRKRRNTPPKVGQPAHLYYGMRTKWCKKLVDPSPEIEKVYVVFIDELGVLILDCTWAALCEREEEICLNGRSYVTDNFFYEELTIASLNALAWNDGFRHSIDVENRSGCWKIMRNWWMQTHGLPFVGHLIQWK